MSYILDTVDLDDYQIPLLPRCSKCDAEIIEAGHWRRASETERNDMLDDGFRRATLDGVCRECAPAQVFSPEIRRRQGLRGDTLRVYGESIGKGMTIQQIADQIGIQRRSLVRTLSEQRKREQL